MPAARREARTLGEIAAATGVPDHVLCREVTKLEGTGLVVTVRRGRLRLVRPNTDLPYFRDLEGLLLETMRPVPVVAEELARMHGIDEACVLGLPVNPVVRQRAEWESGENAFIVERRSRPRVAVLDGA